MTRGLALLLAAGLLVGMTGCVSQGVADDYQTLYRKSEEQIIDLRAQLEEANARIAALQNAGPDAAARQQMQDLMDERDRLREALADAERQLREASSEIVILPEELDDALRDLASQNPDLMDYDPELGMVKFRSDLTFPLGSAEVTDQARQSLNRLAEVLRSQAARQYEVRVVGHTDNVPVENERTRARHPDNWYLSAHRAISVRQILERAGVQPTRLGVAGYGEYRPVVANGRRGAEANRRVEIYLVSMPAGGPSTDNNAGGATPQRPQPTPRQDEPTAPAGASEGPEMFK